MKMSNYNFRNPTLSFRIERSELQHLDKLAKKKEKNLNGVAKWIITQYLKGEIVDVKDEMQTELVKLRIEKIKAEIQYLKIKNNFAENFERPMTRRAEIAIKPQIIEQKQVFQSPQSPYDASNKRLQCIDCGSLFCWYSEKEFNSQMAEFQRHLVSKHDRAKTEIERQVLIELKYEGDSR
jgi:hypothetical protein